MPIAAYFIVQTPNTLNCFDTHNENHLCTTVETNTVFLICVLEGAADQDKNNESFVNDSLLCYI